MATYCLACRIIGTHKRPVMGRSCACGYTVAYCSVDGGRKRVTAEIAEHRATCIKAKLADERRQKIEAHMRRNGGPRVTVIADLGSVIAAMAEPKKPRHLKSVPATRGEE